MNCEKCKQSEGKAYKFYYGKKLGQQKIDSGTTKTNYEIGGSRDIILCGKCILSYRMKKMGIFLGILVLAALLILMGGSWQRFKEGHLSTVQGIVLVIACWIVLFLLAFGLMGKKEMGELLAIDEHKKELKGKGFDTFWGEEKFKKMKIQ